MDTTTELTTSQPPVQMERITRLITASCNLYLVFMIAYLLSRFIFTDQYWWIALPNAGAFYLFAPLVLLIPVAFLLRLWRYVLRLGFLALLAIVWFGPLFLPASSPEYAGGEKLRVVTFNLWGNYNQRIDEVEDWLREIDADVVLLQEVPTQYQENGIVALEDLYPEQHYQGWRQLILAKHPFTIEDPSINTYDIFVIEMEGQPLVIYHVHLSYPFRDGDATRSITGFGPIDFLFNYDESPRNRQIEQLLNRVETETRPYLVVGDFNLSQHSIRYGTLADVLTDSYREAASGLGATWPADTPLLRLDYVFHNDDFHALSSELGPKLGSDHLPLVVELELLADE
jgi:vancomycin resistance protein VanJ